MSSTLSDDPDKVLKFEGNSSVEGFADMTLEAYTIYRMDLEAVIINLYKLIIYLVE